MCRPRSNSSPRRLPAETECSVPSYRNNFNESLKGIEGIVIGVILKPIISKLMKTISELLQPENMVSLSITLACSVVPLIIKAYS